MDKRLFYNSPEGRFHLVIELEEDTIIGMGFCTAQQGSQPETDLEKEICRQLNAYFAGTLQEFDLPFFATGTVFQLKAWEELMKVPYGETVTYGELAARIGHSKAFRAVGGAMNSNPVPLLIPCHRVVGAKGALTGFAGGMDVKQALLDLEHKHK